MVITLLVCAVALAHQDCQMNTAKKVIQGPEVKNKFECMFSGVTYGAQQPVVQELLNQGGNYLKVMCIETTIGNNGA